ncbi:hypothetical protein B1B_15663, partial [mine drainage metagenome]
DASANSLFPTGDDIEGLLAFANSSFAGQMAPLLNPGLHFKLGDMGSLPYLKRADSGWQEEIDELIDLAQRDWDSDSVQVFRRLFVFDPSSRVGPRLLSVVNFDLARRPVVQFAV